VVSLCIIDLLPKTFHRPLNMVMNCMQEMSSKLEYAALRMQGKGRGKRVLLRSLIVCLCIKDFIKLYLLLYLHRIILPVKAVYCESSLENMEFHLCESFNFNSCRIFGALECFRGETTFTGVVVSTSAISISI